MKAISVNDLQSDVSKYLAIAGQEDLLITENGKPIGVLRGFDSEEDVFDYELESHPNFLKRVEHTRQQFHQGQGVSLESVRAELLEE
jgi:antitoxin (DNA-binding transcriptional repressor) of toxin-antitoxin stability system